MSRIQKAKKNIIYSLFSKVVTIVLEIVSRYYFIQYLGIEILGINNVFINIVQILSLAELGINNVVMYSYFEPLATNNYEKISKLNNFYKKIYNKIIIIILLIGILTIPFISNFINGNYQNINIHLIFILYFLNTAFSYLYASDISILLADQKGYLNVKIDTIYTVLRLVIQIVFVILFKSLFYFMLVTLFFTLLTNFTKHVMIKKLYHNIKKTDEDIDEEEKKSIYSIIKAGFLYKISAILLNSTDNIIISSIIGTIYVGYLSNYITLSASVMSFVVILFSSIIGSVGNLIHSDSNEKKLEIFNLLNLVSGWIAIVVFVCLANLSSDFISLWIGKDKVLGIEIIFFQTFIYYLGCTLQPLYSYRTAAGIYRKTRYIMLIAATINIILSLILGMLVGISGILIASIISIFTTYFWFEPIVLYKEIFNSKPNQYFKLLIQNTVIAVVLFWAFHYIFKGYNVQNWIGFFTKSGVMFISINIICFIYFRNREEFKTFKQISINKFIK